MFVRTATRRNKDGKAVRYLQLVHNEWDPAAKAAKMKVLHNFGREDQVDKAAIERLAGSLCRLLDPGRAAALREPGLSYSGSVAYGGPWLLDQLWQRLGIGAILAGMLGRTRRDASAERVLFALVANRALDPSSKLAAAHWVGRKAHIHGLPQTSDDVCCRAMDWLHQVRGAVEKEIFTRSRTCSTSRSTCCSSTPPRRTSSWTRLTSRPGRTRRAAGRGPGIGR